MTGTVSLTIKIDPALKETLKTLALENQISVSQEVSQRLLATLSAPEASDIDNQHTEEEASEQLSQNELKQVRALLKKQQKKKK